MIFKSVHVSETVHKKLKARAKKAGLPLYKITNSVVKAGLENI